MGVSLRFTLPPDGGVPFVKPSHGFEAVWLGEPTGIAGRDLAALRVVEAPESELGPGELGPGIPRSDSTSRRVVPFLEFEFSSTGNERFRELLRTLWEEHERDLSTSRGLALLLKDQLFLTIASSHPDALPGPVYRLERPNEKFETIVSDIESSLGCS